MINSADVVRCQHGVRRGRQLRAIVLSVIHDTAVFFTHLSQEQVVMVKFSNLQLIYSYHLIDCVNSATNAAQPVVVGGKFGVSLGHQGVHVHDSKIHRKRRTFDAGQLFAHFFW